MKKCPKCKAEIQEEARFCLYCMTSFEEKQSIEIPKENSKRWPYIIAAVLVFVFIVSAILILPDNDAPDNSSIGTYSELHDSTDSSSSPSDNNSKESNKPSQNTDLKGDEQTASSVGNNQTQETSRIENSTASTSNPDKNSSIEATTNNLSQTEPGYEYVEATLENAYPTGYSAIYAPENAIVITKVNYKEESGNYFIPDTIDGKKVAAIMPSAFCDSAISSTVKSVTLPSTVRTIWGGAFKDCYNLTDIYIKSGVIAIYTDAFPATATRTGTLTIHCAKDCRDFDFYYYRNISDNYDAEYAQWNG